MLRGSPTASIPEFREDVVVTMTMTRGCVVSGTCGYAWMQWQMLCSELCACADTCSKKSSKRTPPSWCPTLRDTCWPPALSASPVVRRWSVREKLGLGQHSRGTHHDFATGTRTKFLRSVRQSRILNSGYRSWFVGREDAFETWERPPGSA